MSEVMHFPRVQPILWGDFYQSPQVQVSVHELLHDLVCGPFMNGLAQYRIARGQVLSPILINTPAPQCIWAFPSPLSSSPSILDVLQSWFPGTVPSPEVNETNLLYLILPPPETTIYISNGECDPIGNGVQGSHASFKYNQSSINDDVIWAWVKTGDFDRSTPKLFAQNVAYIIGHEIVEAFNDPIGGNEELGDPCESLPGFQYKGVWPVEMYWSDWDNGCIHGDQPPPMSTSFQTVDNYATIYVRGTDGNLWLERPPFGNVPPKRDLVDQNVFTFQALDDTIVLVLRADRSLWFEYGPFGQAPISPPMQVDGDVQAFQAYIPGSVLVLGTDGKLWYEYNLTGQVPPPRNFLADNVMMFEAVGQSDLFFLDRGRSLWLQQNAFQAGQPAPQLVDENVRAFHQWGLNESVWVLGTDGNLWLEYAPYGNVPPKRDPVDTNVLAFQPLSDTSAVVLHNDGKLVVVSGLFGEQAPIYANIATDVMEFVATDADNMLLLKTEGKLWYRSGSSHQLIDATVA